MNTTELQENPYSDGPEYADDFIDAPKPVNVPAVIAFLVSLAGFLYITSTFFFFVPIVAIVLAIVAICVFVASPRPMIGRWMCVVAIALSVFFIVWQKSYEQMRARTISESAVPLAGEWLEFLKEGETMKAHVLTEKFSDRASSQTEMIYEYRDPNLEPDIDAEHLEDAMNNSLWAKHKKFAAGDLVQRIVKHRDSLEYDFVKHVGYNRTDNKTDQVALVYELKYDDEEGNPQNELVHIVLSREDHGEYFNAHWFINRMTSGATSKEAKQLSARRKIKVPR